MLLKAKINNSMRASFFCYFILLLPALSPAAVVGDIDGDGVIHLSEAIYALQVASGQYPSVSNSCQLEGKGDWVPYTTYAECDVVSSSGFHYISTTTHVSSKNFSDDSGNWTMLTLPSAWMRNGSDLYYTDGNIGIGITTTPRSKLEVDGAVTIAESSTSCDKFHEGAIQYDSSTGGFSGCSSDKNNDQKTGDYGWVRLNNAVANIPTVTSGDRTWMDRNLGASRVATSSTDTLSYGSWYQWGRLNDGHEKRNSGTTTDLSSADVPGHSDFITPTEEPYDWRNPQNDNLWQGVSGINNPCPAGFRLPTYTEFETEIDSWGSANRDADGAYNSPLKLVLAGYRQLNGTAADEGVTGNYWSSTHSVSNNMVMIMSNWIQWQPAYHAYGFSIRCIKD